jgi:sulfur-oxidizing protein SoxY
MNPQRRDALNRVGKTAAVAAAIAAGVIRPSHSYAAWNQRAFDAKKLGDAMDALGLAQSVQSGDILIDAPDIAENGALVPLEILSKIPGTESISVFVDRNPWPFIARFDVSRGALPFAVIRVRVGESSPVRVVAQAGGKSYVGVKEKVQVTVGGCAGDTSSSTPAQAADSGGAPKPIRIRATVAGDVASVRVLISHPMENGLRKDASGQPVPEHFVQNVLVQLNGQTVLEAEFGRSVSVNPLIGFKLKGAKAGDKITVRWQDNKGLSRTDEAVVGAS